MAWGTKLLSVSGEEGVAANVKEAQRDIVRGTAIILDFCASKSCLKGEKMHSF